MLGRDPETDTTYGFARKEMGTKALAGTVKHYDVHLFLVWSTATAWPKKIEEGEGEGAAETLPQAVARALSAHKSSLPGKVCVGVDRARRQINRLSHPPSFNHSRPQAKLNVCEAAPGDAEGTLLVFPLELRVQGVTAANADAVVQALFAGPAAGAAARVGKVPGATLGAPLPPTHLFVCSHLKRDKRCGLVGPFLVQRLRAIVAEAAAAVGPCPVRACSHVGGHAYAGNVLAFSRRGGELEGHWFG